MGARTRRQVVVINGPSSSGKTAVAKATQELLGIDWVVVSIDDIFRCVHPKRRNDWKLFEALTRATFESAAAFRRAGFGVLVDTVFERPACLDICVAAVGVDELTLVGLMCPIEALESRERRRRDRRPGLARDQHQRVHEGCSYALRLDTSEHRPEECAEAIDALLERAQG